MNVDDPDRLRQIARPGTIQADRNGHKRGGIAMMSSGNNGYRAAGITGMTAFSVELRAAIKASGLGLDRIQDRLRRRGIPVSVTALSYWQSGKRQPERARSISAVHALEEILNRPAGSLVRLLQPPRPRGHAARRPAGSRESIGQPRPARLE